VDGVKKELIEKGFSESQWNIIESVLTLEGSNDEKLERMKILLGENEIALKGIEEMQFILQRVKAVGLERAKLELDLTLARGLNYYTGAIFEVKANGVQMGSICGGGRYDDLTGIFGLPGLSGVGISFGADRIYDVMMELNLFPTEIGATTKILFANFGEQEEMHILPILRKIRQAGINAEIYPEAAKMKKQFKYADDKKIPFVGVIGTEEIQKNVIALKNMTSGEQELLSLEQVIEKLK
jgi:histidyl-tRNA synthetase